MVQAITCSFCGESVNILPGEGLQRMKRHFWMVDGRRRECMGYRLSKATVERLPALQKIRADRANTIRLQRRLINHGA